MSNITKRIVRMMAIAVAVVVCTTTELYAQHRYHFRDSLGTYEVKFTPAQRDAQFESSPTKPLLPKSHELRLGISWGATDYYGERANNGSNTLDKYMEQPHYSGPAHWYSASFDYGYWINEWASVGGTATWVGGIRNYYNPINHQRIDSQELHHVAIMAIGRFAWLHHGIVQLYSSFALGVGIEMSESYDGRALNYAYCAFDIKPLGISVGRRWFGYAEVGYGSRGVFNIGFGYRINSKQR